MNRQLPDNPSDSREICSVSQINQQLKQTLAGQYSLVWVEGEISNLARPASGHIYFSLKDSQAQLRCVMFRRNNSRVPFEIENGLQVVVRASVSLYEARGDLQLIADSMEEAGFGVLQRQFEALKKKLHEEGLFDAEQKQALPAFPNNIAIITSPTGAAIKDFLTVAQRRYPACKKTLYSVPVQGDQSAAQICSAINAVNQRAAADIIVLIRGGGSIEDLWSFNNEALARTIAASTIPIVTGVGHEIDYTIADFVADLRAPTPSAAAELICPDSHALLAALAQTQQQLRRASFDRLQALAQRTDWLSQRLQRSHPHQIIESQQQSLHRLLDRLMRSTRNCIKHNQYNFHTLAQRHRNLSPASKVASRKVELATLSQRLQAAIHKRNEQSQHQLQLCSATLQAVSPLNTLQRGYSITTLNHRSKQIVIDPTHLRQGDQITTYLASGQVVSTVESTSSEIFSHSTSDSKHADK